MAAGADFDVQAARDHFPALKQPQVFFDNAGGSQTLGDAIESIRTCLSQTNVQLGATYPIAQQSTRLYEEGHKAAAKYINASPDEVVLGASTTQLFRNLSFALKFEPGDELILSKLDHEANIASWVQLAEWRGLTVKWWGAPHSQNPILDTEILKGLLSKKTRLVACTHTSNILGTISDIKKIAATVHTIPGAMLCVDGVAYAPHRQIDMRDLDADFYSFSWYKVYGPHISTLYAARSTHPHLVSLGHYFKPSHTLEDKLGLAASNYELTQSIPQIATYLAQQSWAKMSAHEEKLQSILLAYLHSRPDIITVYGEPSPKSALRVPVISFVVKRRSQQSVVDAIEARSNFGFRYGHMYSKRLVNEILGLDDEGVVRVSLVHYNTEEEVRRFVEVLDEVLEKR